MPFNGVSKGECFYVHWFSNFSIYLLKRIELAMWAPWNLMTLQVPAVLQIFRYLQLLHIGNIKSDKFNVLSQIYGFNVDTAHFNACTCIGYFDYVAISWNTMVMKWNEELDGNAHVVFSWSTVPIQQFLLIYDGKLVSAGLISEPSDKGCLRQA